MDFLLVNQGICINFFAFIIFIWIDGSFMLERVKNKSFCSSDAR